MLTLKPLSLKDRQQVYEMLQEITTNKNYNAIIDFAMFNYRSNK